MGVGDALLLRGYRRRALRNAADPTAGGKYEVSLNTSHPTSRLLPLTDAEVDGGGGDGDGVPDALTLRPLRATDRGAAVACFPFATTGPGVAFDLGMTTDARIFFIPSTLSRWYSSRPVELFCRR